MLPHDGPHNVSHDLAGKVGKIIVVGRFALIPSRLPKGRNMGHGDDVGILAGCLFQHGGKMSGCFVGQGGHRP